MLDSKLERTVLQLDGAQTKISDLERINEELRRTNSDIQRQLVKWQNLETKGDLEVETLRKRRIELEVQVKALETRLEKNTELNTTALEKEQRRVEKFKRGVAEWQAEATRKQTEAEAAQRQLERAQKQVEKLKSELVQRTRVHSSAPRKKGKSSLETSEDEVALAISLDQASSPPSAKSPRDKVKPKFRQAKSRPRAQRVANSEIELIPSGSSDIQELVKVTKAKVASDEVRVVEVEEPVKQRGKRKASSRKEEVITDVETAPPQAKSKKGASTASEARGTGTKSKPGEEIHHRSSVQPRQRHEDDTQVSDTADAAPKKKKRKINLFPTNPESTAFNFAPQVDNGFNIPTILSPVKESDVIPSRSTSGSVMGSIGSMLRNSFAGPRRILKYIVG